MVLSGWRWLCRFALLLVCCQSSLLPSQTAAQPAASSQSQPLATGPYYALVIGNNDYKYLHKLQTAINDANAIAQLLREKYGFQTKVLLDADRQQILNALVEYQRQLPDNSNLLIYYAGHGHHDRDRDESYWLPVDAQSDSNANWISADDITRDIRAVSSAHVLVISDSCYSGYLARDADVAINPADRGAYLEKMLKSKSRNLMASGGDEPVADGGAPGHSIFGATVMESLSRVDEKNFTAAYLFQRYIQPGVAGRSEQVPQYSVIRNSGHAYGDFVFTRKVATSTSPTTSAPKPALTAALLDSEKYLGYGIGPFHFGMTPLQVNTLLPHPFGSVSSLSVAGEFKTARVVYFWVKTGEFVPPGATSSYFEPLTIFEPPCWGSGNSYVTFLFNSNQLFRISFRFFWDCPDQVERARNFASLYQTQASADDPKRLQRVLTSDTIEVVFDQGQYFSAVDIYRNGSPLPQ